MSHHCDPLASAQLRTIKVVHTLVWAFFVLCIVGIPIASSLGYFTTAAFLAAVVFLEIIVLLLNSWSCPLTAVAARYTTERNANFDIYLPEWLARNNKSIFGWLYVFGAIVAALQWAHARG